MKRDSSPIVLIVGESGTGKSTLCRYLEAMHGLKEVKSYTTRPKRYKKENTHIFVDDVEFDELTPMVAYTVYNGYKYGATYNQVEENDLYVIDMDGINYFNKHYKGDKDCVVVYITAPIDERVNRMRLRGDNDEEILDRLVYDSINFAGVDKVANVIYTMEDEESTIKIGDSIYDKFFKEGE